MRLNLLDNRGASSLGFIIVWGMAASCVVAALLFEDAFFQIGGHPIAHITNSIGKISFRSEEQTTWKDANPQQEFFDGDSVATTIGSQTKIQFSKGRSIEVAEETHLMITAIKYQNDNHILINLVNGAVAATVAGKSDYTLTILSGQQAFQLNPGESVGVKKVVGEKPKVIESKKVLLSNYKKPDPPKAIQLPSTFAAAVAAASKADFKENSLALTPGAPEATPVPSTAPEKKEKPTVAAVKPKNFETKLLSPANGKVWYTHSSLENAKEEAISFQISPPTFSPTPGWTFTPAVRLISSASPFKNDPKKGLYLTAQSINQTNFKINFGKILEVAPKTKDPSQVEITSFSASGAAIAKNANDDMRSISQSSHAYRVVSLASLFQSHRPVKMSFEKLTTGPLKAGFFDAKSNLSLTNAPVIIATSNASLLAPYAASIDTGSTFGLSGLKAFEEKGIFVVKGKDIIAQLGGSLLTTELMEEIMKTMGGDFVFEGSRRSLVDLKGLSLAQAAEKLRTASAKSNQIYAVQGNQLIPLSKNFIETNDRVIRFVKGNSNALFLEKVSIIVYR